MKKSVDHLFGVNSAASDVSARVIRHLKCRLDSLTLVEGHFYNVDGLQNSLYCLFQECICIVGRPIPCFEKYVPNAFFNLSRYQLG